MDEPDWSQSTLSELRWRLLKGGRYVCRRGRIAGLQTLRLLARHVASVKALPSFLSPLRWDCYHADQIIYSLS
jgi:hypothetical protein